MPDTAPVSTPQKAPASRTRRSARVLEHDPIVAPGFGTRKDLSKLAKELSQGTNNPLPVAAVEAMMRSRGRGIRNKDDDETPAAAAAAPASSAWADFMAEEGVGASSSGGQTESSKKRKSAPTAVPGAARVYELPLGETNKKVKAKDKGGVLLQAGTIDSTVVGRAKVKLVEPYHLTIPTRILPSVRITKVFTSCNAVHSIALDSNGTAWGWGRNECSQLAGNLPDDVVLPTPLELPGTLVSAAMGKSHTLFLMEDGSVYGIGANKMGQLGVRTSTDVHNYRKCVIPEDVTIVQIACGEAFSVALDSEGRVYSTGSSEFGQLGNGETGEHIVTAGKVAFANSNVFLRRSTFCHAPSENVYSNSQASKVVPLAEDVRIQSIACGKNHTIALEASSDQTSRVFSWGCGNYGVLGHGVQADEFFPRCIGSFQNLTLGQGNMDVSAGSHCSLLQTANGHVYYWGKHRSVGEATMRPALIDALANNQHVVVHCDAGGATVVCSTANAVTVSWGVGPHGELGLGDPKSSAKPTFVAALDGCRVGDLACGYGHTLYVLRNEDKEDMAAIDKQATLDTDSVAGLIKAAEENGNKKRA